MCLSTCATFYTTLHCSLANFEYTDSPNLRTAALTRPCIDLPARHISNFDHGRLHHRRSFTTIYVIQDLFDVLT